MEEIQGQARTVRQLLSGNRFRLDYYQREYKWESRQVRELLEDLSSTFLDDYQPSHARAEVQNYGHYFLGSIILSRRGIDTYIIDGQQRLTTLTLLLILLHTRLESDDRAALDDLIFSRKFGQKSFNIEVEEREPVMDALYAGEQYDQSAGSESVQNLVERYNDLDGLFPEDIDSAAIPYFADWLIENVHLVEILAHSDEDAYTIFETMNDRGLSLAPLDMLKGWVLANIHQSVRGHANARWRETVRALQELGKEEAADAVKAWLRSRYARTIREHRRGAEPGDFDRLGTDFHRWVKEKAEAIGLRGNEDFVNFVERDMAFYAKQYRMVREAVATETVGLEPIYHNGRLQFTLQYPLLLSVVDPADDQDSVAMKMQLVATFIDITLARRLWNFRSIAYNRMVNPMFGAMVAIRGKDVQGVAAVLRARLEEESEVFASNERMHLHGHNRPSVRYLLARMTDYVERGSGLPHRFAEYIATGRESYDVEHIWADKYDRFADEFGTQQDFADYRNRMGGLLLLPKSFNRSYGGLSYEEKLPHYLEQNLLAKSLHEQAYTHNPGFRDFRERIGLQFSSHDHFKKADLDDRQKLYLRLAEAVWDPRRLERS